MDKKSAPAFSFAGKPKQIQYPTTPGPATYNYDAKKFFKGNSTGVRIPSQKRERDFSTQSPGPGNYDVINKNHHSSFNVIMTHKPKPDYIPLIPGPGAYQPNYQMIKKALPKWIYKDRTYKKDWIRNIKKNPGPADYNVNTNFDSSHKTSERVIFGNSSRLDRRIMTQATPGPGTYESQNCQKYLQIDRQLSFSRDIRSRTSINKTPGPGQYKIKTELDESVQKRKGYHLGIKIRCKTEQKIPGPGAYANLQYNTKINRNPSYSIQKASRINERSTNVPSPCAYNTSYSSFGKIGGTIAKSKRQQESKQLKKVPGPGAYESNSQKRGKQFSFTRSRFFDSKSSTPGHQYDPKPVYQTKYSSIGFGMAKRQGSIYINKTPGPGQYKSQNYKAISLSKSGNKIGNSKRSFDKGSKSPGPGQYNLPSYISNIPSFANSQILKRNE